MNFPCSGKALMERHNHRRVFSLIRDLNVKWRWRQVKAILLINSYWRNFCFDYYSPGNGDYDAGIGYLKAKEK